MMVETISDHALMSCPGRVSKQPQPSLGRHLHSWPPECALASEQTPHLRGAQEQP